MLGYAVPVPLHAVCALTCKSWRAAILALPPARVDVAAAGVFVRELDVVRCLALRGVASSGAFALDGRGCSQIGARAVRALQRWAHTSLRELRLHELKKGGATLAARQHLLFRSFPNLQVLEIEFCAGLTFATTALPPRTLRSLALARCRQHLRPPARPPGPPAPGGRPSPSRRHHRMTYVLLWAAGARRRRRQLGHTYCID